MPSSPRNPIALVLALALVVSALPAQAPLQLNTTVRSFTSVSGSPWVADIWSYTDSQGRDFALVCRGNTGLAIYDITNPAAPVLASAIPATASDLKDVKVYQDIAICVQQGGPALVVDISDPYNATVINSSAIPAGHNGTVDETTGLFYLTRNGASPYDMRIFDVTNGANPVQVGVYDRPAGGYQTHDMAVDGDRAYVSVIFGPVGTDIVDISDPSNPTFIGQVPSGTLSHNCWIYRTPGGRRILGTTQEETGGHLKLWDVTNDETNNLIAEYQTPTGGNISIHNVYFFGRYAYISYYADYLRILDMANPSQPVEVGVYDPIPGNVGVSVYDGAWGVSLVKILPNGDHRLLLTQSFINPRGFWVIDFTPPPVLDMDMSTSGAGDFSMTVSGADPFSTIYNLVSLDTAGDIGQGPLVGLGGDAVGFLTGAVVGSAPFLVAADASGTYNFSVPAGALPAGLTVDVRSVANVGGTPLASQLGRITF